VIVRAADRFHCPPWEILARGKVWVELALAAISAENGAAVEKKRAADRRAKAARRMGGR